MSGLRSVCSDMDAYVKPASSCDAARWLSFFSSSPGYSGVLDVRTAVGVAQRDDRSL